MLDRTDPDNGILMTRSIEVMEDLLRFERTDVTERRRQTTDDVHWMRLAAKIPDEADKTG